MLEKDFCCHRIHSSKYLRFILFTLIALIVNETSKCLANEYTWPMQCDLSENDEELVLKMPSKSFVTLNVLNLNSESTQRSHCGWKIQTNTGNQVLYLSRLILSPNDKLSVIGNITTNQSKTESKNIYDYDAKTFQPGLIFITAFREIAIDLTINKTDKTKRSFEIVLLMDYDSVPLMRDSGNLMLPINQDKNSSIINFKFELKAGEEFSDRLVMLNFIDSHPSFSLKIDDQTYDSKTTLPVYYIPKNDSISIEILKYDVARYKPLELNYWLLSRDCSRSLTLNNKSTTFQLPIPNEDFRHQQLSTEMICGYIINSDEKDSIQLGLDSRMKSMPNKADTLTIYSILDREIVATISNQNLPVYRDAYTFFPSTPLLLFYDSPFFQKAENIYPINFTLTNNSVHHLSEMNSSKTISIEKSKDNSKLILIFYSDILKNLLVSFSATDLPKNTMNISIFNTDKISSSSTIQPIVLLDGFEILPPVIAINHSVMRIELSGKFESLSMTIRHQSLEDCHSLSTFNSIFKINNNTATDCTWFIPRDNTVDYFVLNPSLITLANAEMMLEMTQFKPKNQMTLFKGRIKS
ncbi:hypothetical protein QR98_0079390 [Sarcoptes scabiei]|uniref:Uncharacterized protein n=1 Tax=Sarcoptes scabiei TaxID=52283 RepID=A0A132AEJ2_SARSC|nr:hypothetical protein QR98_0079390 [Sarcoptes scabiei]